MAGGDRRIVVGVDGSPAGDRALEWAIAEAERSGASLHLVSAWLFPMALGYAFTTTVEDVRRNAQDVMDDAMARVAGLAPGSGSVARPPSRRRRRRSSPPPRAPSSWSSAPVASGDSRGSSWVR